MTEDEPKFVGTRRFGGQPLRQPAYNFRDVPYCSKDLSGSTLSEVTDRQHLVDSIAEFALLCNEATRRKHLSEVARGKKSRCPSKPLGIEYIFDRIDTDDPIWGFMVRTDTPMSSKGRTSNLKASPQWKRGMLQGFITVTTFTQWRSSFRFDSLHESAFAYDPDDLTELALKGIRKYDNDGRLAEELEATVHGGDPWNEGIVYPRIAEISLFGALGCGKKLLQLVIERLERLKASDNQNYNYIVLQATENSIPFYESMGFVRVGCIMENKTSDKGYKCSPVESYVTKKHGETLAKISQQFGCDVWDTVFLNKPMYPTIEPRSWLKRGTTVFYLSMNAQILATSDASKVGQLGGTLEESSLVPKWYVAKENETPRSISKKFGVKFEDLLECNKRRYPELVGTSRLKNGTRIQVSRFDVEDEAYIPYSHWTFPDDELEPDEPSYMMAKKLERKSGKVATSLPIAESLSVSIRPYSPEDNGASEILQKPPAIKRTAPIFNPKIAKPPKKPKRPMNAFHFFSADYRSSKRELLQGMRLGECTKILTQEWKKLSDREKAPYLEKSKEMRIAYAKEMDEYKKEILKLTPVGIDTSLLEQVVKLKSNVGAQSFTSKFQYWYVLTFIPDLQWVHLIPLKKVGVFGPEYPEAHGRTIWMIEEEGNELDTTAAMCTVVKSQTIANSEDADDEQWVIFDGENPKLAPIFTAKIAPQALKEPIKPKNPPSSYALFCADSKTKLHIGEELKGKNRSEHEPILFSHWDSLKEDQKQPYREQEAKIQSAFEKEVERYKSEMAEWKHLRPDAKPVSQPDDVKTNQEPTKPKKGPSSYLLFCADARTKPHIKEELKRKSRLERATILSNLWDSMDEEQKRPYREQEAKLLTAYKKATEKYKAELAEWKRHIANVQLRPHHTVNQVGREPTKPKKCPTSYTLFCADAKTKPHLRKELSGKALPERSQILSKHWESMNEEQKMPYKEQQSKLQSAYENEMEKYKTELAEWKRQISNGPLLPHYGVNQVSNEPTKPKKYPTSFSLFCSNLKSKPHIKDELRGKSLSERSQILSKHWESIDEEQKKPYKEQQAKLRSAYEKEMEKYKTDLAEWKRHQRFLHHSVNHLSKQPTKPKKFPTSYSFFCADAKIIPHIQDELKGKSLSERSQILSKHWESMNEEQKQPYKEKQAKSKSAYEDDMKKYKADLAEWKRQTSQVKPFPDNAAIQSNHINQKLLSSLKSTPKSKSSTSLVIAREIPPEATKSKMPSTTRSLVQSKPSSIREAINVAKIDSDKSTKRGSNPESLFTFTSRSGMEDCNVEQSQVQLAPIFLPHKKKKKSLTEASNLTSTNPFRQFCQATSESEIKGNRDNIHLEHLESITSIRSSLPNDTVTIGCSQNSGDHSIASENLEVEIKKMLEYCAPCSENAWPVKEKEKLVRGDIVMVAKRTMPGTNKLGGVARVTKVHQSGDVRKYDVSYVLGGREKEVEEWFVSLHQDANEMETESYISGRKRRSYRNGAVNDNVTMLVSDDANSATSMEYNEPCKKRRRIKS